MVGITFMVFITFMGDTASQKLIRIAYKSADVWRVDEYISDELASGSEEEKRLKKAMSVANRKRNPRKLATDQKREQKPPIHQISGFFAVRLGIALFCLFFSLISLFVPLVGVLCLSLFFGVRIRPPIYLSI